MYDALLLTAEGVIINLESPFCYSTSVAEYTLPHHYSVVFRPCILNPHVKQFAKRAKMRTHWDFTQGDLIQGPSSERVGTKQLLMRYSNRGQFSHYFDCHGVVGQY